MLHKDKAKEAELISTMHLRIGEVLNEFNSLEDDIRRFISQSLGIYDRLLTAPILGQMSTRQLISAFDSLVKYIAQRDNEVLADLSRLFSQLTKRETERNKLVHSRYGILFTSNDSVSTYRSMNERAKKGAAIAPNLVKFSDKEFQDWLIKVRETRKSLDQFAIKFFTKYEKIGGAT